MSNKIVQACNVCGTDNITGDKTWTRLFGAYLGAPNIGPAYVPPGQALPPGSAKPILVDLCPTCAPKTTVAQLVEMTTPAKTTAPAAK